MYSNFPDIYEDVFNYIEHNYSLEDEIFNNVTDGFNRKGVNSSSNFLSLCEVEKCPFFTEYYDFYIAGSQNLKRNRDFWWWFISQSQFSRIWWYKGQYTSWETRTELLPQLTYTTKYIIIDRGVDMPYFNKFVDRVNSILTYNSPNIPRINEKFNYISTKNVGLRIDEIVVEDIRDLKILDNYFYVYDTFELSFKNTSTFIFWESTEDLEDILSENLINYYFLLFMLPKESIF